MYNYSPMYEYWVAQMSLLMEDREDIVVTAGEYDVDFEHIGSSSFNLWVNGRHIGAGGCAERCLDELLEYFENEVDEGTEEQEVVAVGAIMHDLLDDWHPDSDD